MQTESFQCIFLVPLLLLFLVYVGIFSIFVSIDGRAKLSTVKFQQILWFPGYASEFETSWFITNNFLFLSIWFHLMPESSQLNDSRELSNLVMIKDLL